MDGPLQRYHARSARYTLQTEDQTLIRIAGPHQTPWEEGTEIKNISLSGLAFTAANDFCPIRGELIKIQFNPPGASQMACYATVTRIEQGPTQSLVGVRFEQLDLAQRLHLSHALTQGLKRQEQKEKSTHRALFWRERGWRLGIVLLLLMVWTLANWAWWTQLP